MGSVFRVGRQFLGCVVPLLDNGTEDEAVSRVNILLYSLGWGHLDLWATSPL